MCATDRAGGSEADQTQRYAGGGKPHIRLAQVHPLFPQTLCIEAAPYVSPRRRAYERFTELLLPTKIWLPECRKQP